MKTREQHLQEHIENFFSFPELDMGFQLSMQLNLYGQCQIEL